MPFLKIRQLIAVIVTLKSVFMTSLIVGMLMLSDFAAAQDPTPSGQQIPVYGRFETSFDVSASYSNPFDTSQIAVDVQFIAPSNKRVTVPAFWMQPYTLETGETDSGLTETLQPSGTPGWRVRFAPDEVGAWRYTITARVGDAIIPVTEGSFEAVESANPGYIRVGENQRYFRYDNGQAYFPVGVNLGWSWDGAGSTAGYIRWLESLAAVGGNYARLYVDVPWFIGLDWHTPVGNYTSPGTQEHSARLDAVIEAADRLGIALQVVIVWHQGLLEYDGLPVLAPEQPARPNIEADWTDNPYNAARGGPFSAPSVFMAAENGSTLLQRKLRYLVARWGYSPAVFAWEMIDQLDRIPVGDDPSVVTNWLQRNVGFLRSIDPYRHPITAGVRDRVRADLLASVVLDFEQVRFFQRRPIEETVNQVSGALNALSPVLNTANRPVLMNEFSLSPWFEPVQDDPTGEHIRETMWASTLSGSAGAAATWWWDTYVFPNELQGMFAPIAAFTRDIPWDRSRLQPVDISLLSDSALAYQPYRIAGFGGSRGAPPGPDQVYRVTADGIVPPIGEASQFIYGLTYNSGFSRPQKYIITPPVDTRLTINVSRVSDNAGARLVVLIDGETAGELSMPRSTGAVSMTIPITAGEHLVVIDNLGEDYLQLDSIEVAAYVTPLRTLALADRENGIFLAWFHNRAYTWDAVAQNAPMPDALNVSVRVTGMPPGRYRVEQWDVYTGSVVGEEELSVDAGNSSGTLTVPLLPINRMLALRAIRIAEPGDVLPPTQTPTPTPRIQPTAEPTATPGA
jgi:hypothetical protein